MTPHMRGVDWTRRVKAVGCFVSLLGVFCVAAALQIHAQTPPRRKADVADRSRGAAADRRRSAAALTRWQIGRLSAVANRLEARTSGVPDMAPGYRCRAPVQLTFAEGGVQPPTLRWSPDGKTLFWCATGRSRCCRLTAANRARCPGTPPPSARRRGRPTAAPIYFLASDAPSAEDRDRIRLRDDVYTVDEGSRQRHLWKVDVSTGVETQVTTGSTTVNEYSMSADGKRIAFERAPSPADMDLYRGEVWVMDANGGNASVLTNNSIEEKTLNLSPDGTQVLFLADTNERFEPNYPTNLFIISAGGGTPRLAVPEFKYAFDQAVWMPDGKTILAVGEHGGSQRVLPHRRRISARRADDQRGSLHPAGLERGADRGRGWCFSWTNRHVLVRCGRCRSPGRATPTRITSQFDRLDRDFAIPRQERAEWKGADETPVEGVLFTRRTINQGGVIHSSCSFTVGRWSPISSASVRVRRFTTYRSCRARATSCCGRTTGAASGTALRSRVTSSTDIPRDGVGRAARRRCADRRGLVDPDRLVLMGWSAGGTLVDKLITMTARFKVASSGAGIANWISLYGQTDSTAFRRTWFGGTPWRNDAPFELFWNNFPIKDVSKVNTPTLFFAGEADTRVPPVQSIEMFRALKSLQVPTQLLIAPTKGINGARCPTCCARPTPSWSGSRSTRTTARIPGKRRRDRKRETQLSGVGFDAK